MRPGCTFDPDGFHEGEGHSRRDVFVVFQGGQKRALQRIELLERRLFVLHQPACQVLCSMAVLFLAHIRDALLQRLFFPIKSDGRRVHPIAMRCFVPRTATNAKRPQSLQDDVGDSPQRFGDVLWGWYGISRLSIGGAMTATCRLLGSTDCVRSRCARQESLRHQLVASGA